MEEGIYELCLVEEFAEELVKKHPDIELAAVMGKQVVRTGNQ